MPDLWSGIPDDLREKVEAYGNALSTFCDGGDLPRFSEYRTAEAALVSALRELVADATAYEALRRFMRLDYLPAGEIGMDPDGEISVEWYHNQVNLISVSIGRNVSWVVRAESERDRGHYLASEPISGKLEAWLERHANLRDAVRTSGGGE